MIKIKKGDIISHEDELYLNISKSGIPAMYTLTDNIEKTTFENYNGTFLKIIDIIKWYENELEYASDKNKKIINGSIKYLNSINENGGKE